MAEARMLNISIATDERLNALSRDAMLFYLMAVPHLDRDGLIDGRPRIIWAQVAPLQDDWLQMAPALIAEWIEAGLVVSYGDERPVLWFVGFQKNQAAMRYDRERASRYPAPPGYVRTSAGLIPEESMHRKGAMPDKRRTHSGVSPAKVRSDAGVSPELVRQDSGSGPLACAPRARAEDQHQIQDQDQDQTQVVVDGDLSFPPSASGFFEKNARARGEKISAGEMLFAFPEEQLRRGAFELGAGLGLHMEWAGYEQWLARQPASTVVMLMQWCQFYSDLPVDAMKKIHSLTAVIRKNLNDGIHAPLSGNQTLTLAALVERVGHLADA